MLPVHWCKCIACLILEIVPFVIYDIWLVGWTWYLVSSLYVNSDNTWKLVLISSLENTKRLHASEGVKNRSAWVMYFTLTVCGCQVYSDTSVPPSLHDTGANDQLTDNPDYRQVRSDMWHLCHCNCIIHTEIHTNVDDTNGIYMWE